MCETKKKGVAGVPKNARKLGEKSGKGVTVVPKELTAEQLEEATRISGELVKLAAAGAISGPDDPEAVFYAHVIRAFGGAYTGILNSEHEVPAATPVPDRPLTFRRKSGWLTTPRI
jgi:hypothetical protein